MAHELGQEVSRRKPTAPQLVTHGDLDDMSKRSGDDDRDMPIGVGDDRV